MVIVYTYIIHSHSLQKAEALELSSVEKHSISSHSNTVSIQLRPDNMVAMQLMSSSARLSKKFANQPAMFIPLNPATYINLETSIPSVDPCP